MNKMKHIDKIMSTVMKGLKSKDPYTFDLEEARVLAVDRVISSGIPLFDLHLYNEKKGNEYGLPRGRVVEMYGNSGSMKTSLAQLFCARALSQDGMAFYFESEGDFDPDYQEHFQNIYGVTEKQKKRMSVTVVNSVEDAAYKIKSVVEDLKDFAQKLVDKGEYENLKDVYMDVPLIIVLDSLGSLRCEEDIERREKDFKKTMKKEGETSDGNTNRVGAKASAIHEFFKDLIREFQVLGICFLFTNHVRDNLGFGYAKYVPAHDSATKFYPSLRLELKQGKPMKDKTSYSIGYSPGFELDVKVKKIRGPATNDNKFVIDYYYDTGFDYVGSLIETIKETGVGTYRARCISFENELSEELCEKFPKFTEWANKGKVSQNKLRNALSEDPELYLEFQEVCFSFGPRSNALDSQNEEMDSIL